MTTTEEVLAAIDSFTKEYDVNNAEQNKSIALNVYVRDFLLGIAKERDVNHVGSWAAYVGNRTPRLYDVPMATILSSLYFSEGDEEQANHYLGVALEINPEYSLAVLLNRVYQSGWAPEGFSSMRNHLHDLVKAEIGL